MIKKIAVSQLRLGMHLVKLDGGWVNHPFWKTRFVITEYSDLQRLLQCNVTSCWIDTARGLDVQPEPERPKAEHAAQEAQEEQEGQEEQEEPPVLPTLRAPPTPAPTTRPLAEELREAAAICQRGRTAVLAMFKEARMGRSINAESCLPLVQDISDSVARNPGALVSLSRLKTRDDYSYMHSVAVCALMVAMARQLGWDETRSREAGLAGLMHDIGKALIPVELLQKPGKLTDAEMAIIRKHPQRGHDLLLESQGVAASTLDVVLHHHERMDGEGYPHRLHGPDISELARMGALCDVYDAITSDRPYKAGWDPAESISRMASWHGHFDGPLLVTLVQSLGIYPTGSQVRLESQQLAMVVEQNPGHLVAPQVRVFYSLRLDRPVEPVLLDLAAPGCQDRIVARAPRVNGRFQHLDELWAGSDTLQGLRGVPSARMC